MRTNPSAPLNAATAGHTNKSPNWAACLSFSSYRESSHVPTSNKPLYFGGHSKGKGKKGCRKRGRSRKKKSRLSHKVYESRIAFISKSQAETICDAVCTVVSILKDRHFRRSFFREDGILLEGEEPSAEGNFTFLP
ncbi:hypothetical protein, unlikely [Trypanosoma congolense IL3000]|uniref:Uncharacterized protein n=1 Tax=Trypanosoma congolense (strain IL3000) TaxID=1068625 RepID=F9W7N3_TRYCI|nr:hypothetical protein, unlikely [Trypanosoma congolense IL3000]